MQAVEHGAASGGLKIGAVARLTGLSVHTLRKWEDRYSAVSPKRRPGGERIYSRADLKRLALIRGLAQAGMPLGEVASMPVERLEAERDNLVQAPALTNAAATHASELNVVIIGDALPALVARQQGELDKLTVVDRAPSLETLDLPRDIQSLDVVIVERAIVDPESRQGVDAVLAKTRAKGVIVVYGFAARSALTTLRGSNIALMRAPVDASELQRTALGLMYDINLTGRVPLQEKHRGDDTIPPRRLSKETIAGVAATVPRVQCECPHHLADLLFSLRALEDYSASCENRNPTDAALHHYLWSTTARARANFEEALVRVAGAEGITLSERALQPSAE